MKKQKGYFAVSCGRNPGVYTDYNVVIEQVKGYPGGRQRKFDTIEMAKAFVEVYKGIPWNGINEDLTPVYKYMEDMKSETVDSCKAEDCVINKNFTWDIYTDGSYFNSTGLGGYSAIIIYDNDSNIPITVSGYKYKTSIAEMELIAVVKSLKKLNTYKVVNQVTVYTDYKIIVNAFTNNYFKKWKKQNWKRKNGSNISHKKLWKKIYKLSKKYNVNYVWVNGHKGVKYNELCDRMARLECVLAK